MISSEAFYDGVSDSYEAKSKTRSLYIEKVNSKIIEILKKKDVKTYLDIGIGDGTRASLLISKLGISKENYFGIEPSKKMYQIASKNLLKKNLYNKNLEDFKNDFKFDCIWFLWNVIGHIDQPEFFFSKLTKSINNNGYIIFDFNNLFNIEEYGRINYLKNKILGLFISKFKFKLNYKSNCTYVYFYKKSYILKILEQNNINLESTYYINYQNGNIEKNMSKGQVLMVCKYKSK